MRQRFEVSAGMNYVKRHLEITDYSQLFDCEPEALDKVRILEPGAVVVYVHLPKAAGNSSILVLRDHFPPYVSVNWRKPKKHVETIVANWKEKPVHFISGHTNHVSLDLIRASSIPHVCVTFLRHPVERIISSYRYAASSNAPNSEAFLVRHPTLEHFVFEAVKTNEISRFMFGRNVQSLDEYKEEMKKFVFVGVSELLPICHLFLTRMLKCPFTYPGHANVTNNPHVGTAVSQRVLDYLYTTQQMDLMFHSYILERYCQMTALLIDRADGNIKPSGGTGG